MSTPTNLYELLAEIATSEDGDTPAVHSGERSFSWQQLRTAVDDAASAMKARGVDEGARILMMLPNQPAAVVALYALHKLGAVAVLVPMETADEELADILEDSQATGSIHLAHDRERVLQSVMVTGRDLLEFPVHHPEDPSNVNWAGEDKADTVETAVGGDSTALIRYTAGVSGSPKGALLSHDNILFSASETDNRLRYRSSDILEACIPLSHPFGTTLQLHLLPYCGASLRLEGGFGAAHTVENARTGRSSVVCGLPYQIVELMDAAGDGGLGKLAYAVTGGGPVDSAVSERFRTLTGRGLATVYGTCEVGPTVSVNPAHLDETPDQTLGRAVAGMDVRIVNEENQPLGPGEIGEIVVKGPGVFRGYTNMPNATAVTLDQDGYFHTTDLGQMDIDGWLYISGRLHDRINRGGFSVFPREVEQVLCSHDAVQDAAVIGLADKRLGEEIVAYVSFKEGRTTGPEILIDYCTQSLAKFKVPGKIVIVHEVPRSANGVPLRRQFRERAEEGW